MAKYDEIRGLLEGRLSELKTRVASIESDLRSLANPDWEEHAVEAEDDDTKEELEKASLQEMDQIYLALKQIDEDNYGECLTCGEPIAVERLKAVPFATQCITCAKG